MNFNTSLLKTISEDSENNYSGFTPATSALQGFVPISTSIDSRYKISELLENYKKIRSEYYLTCRSEIMIKRMLNFSKVPREFNHYPLLKVLMEISCEMMLSELELAAFYIFLKRFLWPDNPNSFVLMINVLALAVKYHFTTGLDTVGSYLNEKIPNFTFFFNSWMEKNESLIWITPIELNKAFIELVSIPYDSLPVEYNYYVDSILEMAPASVYEKPAWQETVLLNPSEIDNFADPPSLFRLDSIFAGIGEFKDLPILASILSTTSINNFDLQWTDKSIE